MIKKIPYPCSAEKYFTLFADKAYPVWLDSPCSKGIEIISCEPEKVLTTDKFGAVELYNRSTQKKEKLNQDALSYLDEHCKTCSNKSYKDTFALEEQQLPFSGGWIGLINYEFGETLKGLSSNYLNKNSVTGLLNVFAYYNWAIIIDHNQHSAYLFSKTELNNNHPYNKNLPAKLNPFSLSRSFQNNTSKAKYEKSFNEIQDFLRSGDCYQVNFSQRFESTYTGHPSNAYLMLRNKLKAPFSCYFDWGKGSLLSFSPERFIQLKDKQLTTEPIKGTAPRFSNPIEDTQSKYNLKNSAKDQAENLMIVDLLRNDLSRISKPKSMIVDELFGLYSFSNVHHLISRIKSEIAADKNATDIIRHCFPGGSITGAPKKRAMEIINQLEDHAREIYCGSIFILSDNGYFDSSILIRSLLCKNNKIYCWAGGGIVADSKFESEYQECFNKVNAILEGLDSSQSCASNEG